MPEGVSDTSNELIISNFGGPFLGQWVCNKHGIVGEQQQFGIDYLSTMLTISLHDKTTNYCLNCISEFMAEHFSELKYVETVTEEGGRKRKS